MKIITVDRPSNNPTKRCGLREGAPTNFSVYDHSECSPTETGHSPSSRHGLHSYLQDSAVDGVD